LATFKKILPPKTSAEILREVEAEKQKDAERRRQAAMDERRYLGYDKNPFEYPGYKNAIKDDSMRGYHSNRLYGEDVMRRHASMCHRCRDGRACEDMRHFRDKLESLHYYNPREEWRDRGNF